MKYTTGQRLKKVAEHFFEGNMSELARNLEMKPQALSKYAKGESMPGGLILMRLYEVGVNINWFLTGEGSLVRHGSDGNVSEPLERYLARLEEEISEAEEKERLHELMEFSEVLKGMDISSSMQRALLLVFTRHIAKEVPGKDGN